MFLAPSVTPWKNVVTSNNPSVRMYLYNKSTGEITDYKQYYMDLKQANKGHPEWKLEYQATKAYNISNMSAESMHYLTLQLYKNITLFDEYFKYTSVSFNDSKCSDKCYQQVLCAISMLDYSEYDECIKAGKVNEGIHPVLNLYNNESPTLSPRVHVEDSSSGTYTVMLGFMTIVLIMFVILMVIFRRGVNKNTVKYAKLQNANA